MSVRIHTSADRGRNEQKARGGNKDLDQARIPQQQQQQPAGRDFEPASTLQQQQQQQQQQQRVGLVRGEQPRRDVPRDQPHLSVARAQSTEGSSGGSGKPIDSRMQTRPENPANKDSRGWERVVNGVQQRPEGTQQRPDGVQRPMAIATRPVAATEQQQQQQKTSNESDKMEAKEQRPVTWGERGILQRSAGERGWGGGEQRPNIDNNNTTFSTRQNGEKIDRVPIIQQRPASERVVSANTLAGRGGGGAGDKKPLERSSDKLIEKQQVEKGDRSGVGLGNGISTPMRNSSESKNLGSNSNNSSSANNHNNNSNNNSNPRLNNQRTHSERGEFRGGAGGAGGAGGNLSQEDTGLDRDRRHRRRRGKDREEKDMKYTIAPRILTKKPAEGATTATANTATSSPTAAASANSTTNTAHSTTPAMNNPVNFTSPSSAASSSNAELKPMPSPPFTPRDVNASSLPSMSMMSASKVPISRMASPMKADSSSSHHSYTSQDDNNSNNNNSSNNNTPHTFQILRSVETEPKGSPPLAPAVVAAAAKTSNVPVKLLNKRLKLNSEPLESLLKDQYDFTVIGILGGEGVGKSTIMSSLCKHCSTQPERPEIFPVQTEESILNCCHETSGVDVFVTPERVILLDSQPLQSPSVLATMIREDVPLPASLSLQNHFELQNLQLVLFLLSVCHVVIVASDWVSQNIRLWKLIRTALMLKRTLATPPMLAADKDSPDATLDIVFLVNKAQSHQMSVNARIEVAKTLRRVFKDAPFRQNGMVSNTPQEKTVNLYHLPAIDNEDEKSLYTREYFESCCRAFRNRMLSFPKLPTKKKMTEREWLRSACRIWNEIDTAPSMQEYKKILTSMIT